MAALHPTTINRDAPVGRWSFDRVAEVLGRLARHEAVSQTEIERAASYAGRRFMKVGDAMKILGVKSPTTLKKWTKQGVFPGAHQENGQWLFPVDRVYALRDSSLRAAQMNASGEITQEVYEGEDLFRDLGL